jgi:hypothetical protein
MKDNELAWRRRDVSSPSSYFVATRPVSHWLANLIAVLVVVPHARAATPNLQFDHVWIVVQPDAASVLPLNVLGFAT